MHVCVIGGGGTIGSTLAYTLSITRPRVDVTLIDVRAEVAVAHATDITHANAHRTQPFVQAMEAETEIGTVRVAPPGDPSVASADCLVVTASAPRPAGGSERGGRLAYLERNLRVAEEIGEWLGTVDPRPMICVTNPVDRITDALWRACGWPRQFIAGYSLSETARLADWLARTFETSPSRIYCPIIGEHGENIVPVFSKATIDGSPITLQPEERQAALDYVRDIPYDIIQARGPEHSSRWVTARGIAYLVDALLADDLQDPISLSVPLSGEYGYDDVCLSVPIDLSSSGWTRIYEWELSEWEAERFERAAQVVGDWRPD